MQDELRQFERNKFLEIDPSTGKHCIRGTKWVFRNKLEETLTLMKNKAQLVAK